MPGQKLVFGSKDHVFYSIELFIPVGKDLFVQRAGSVLSKESEIRVLNTVAQNLRSRPESEVPTDPGSCIDGGFISWQGGFERASLGIRLSEFPDVHFSIQAIKNQEHLIESSALEPRLERVAKEGRIWCSRVKFFRRGPASAKYLSRNKYEVLANIAGCDARRSLRRSASTASSGQHSSALAMAVKMHMHFLAGS